MLLLFVLYVECKKVNICCKEFLSVVMERAIENLDSSRNNNNTTSMMHIVLNYYFFLILKEFS